MFIWPRIWQNIMINKAVFYQLLNVYNCSILIMVQVCNEVEARL